jgi:transcriptional regulator with XRE-family HTH domain
MQYKYRIKEVRISENRSQLEISTALGISRSFYSELENGKYKISGDMLMDIGKALQVCPCLLVEDYCENCTIPDKKCQKKQNGKNKRHLHVKQFWLLIVNIYQIFKY